MVSLGCTEAYVSRIYFYRYIYTYIILTKQHTSICIIISSWPIIYQNIKALNKKTVCKDENRILTCIKSIHQTHAKKLLEKPFASYLFNTHLFGSFFSLVEHIAFINFFLVDYVTHQNRIHIYLYE